MSQLKNKTALITGAASGIGRATALRFAEQGAQVMLADIDQAGLAETAAALPSGSEHNIIRLDVTDPENCNTAMDTCLTAYGKLDVLCNIAGIPICQHMHEITDDEWMRAIAVNLNGVFFMSRAAMPHLIKTKGNIINMASTAGLTGQAYNSAYAATKAGVVMFTKSLALEYSAQQVRVNAVCPGMVKTPLTDNFAVPENADANLLGRLFPLLEGAEPAEIAAAVGYLASDEARFVTGSTLAIDGGQTAG